MSPAPCPCRTVADARPHTRMRMLPATPHAAAALRKLAALRGLELRDAGSLLEIAGTELEAFASAAADELTSIEAGSTRVMTLHDVPFEEQLAAALAAPTLAQYAARRQHRRVVELIKEPESFISHYQPIVELAHGTTVGHEALLRTRDGAASPAELFSAAADMGSMHILDRIGRECALSGAAGWLGSDELLFVNFVPTSIYRPEECLRSTLQAARKAGIRLDQLVFEVTESEQVHDLDHLVHILRYYRERGAKVALDDVGAGYSSLNRLAAVRPDVVKLDKQLVQALPSPTATAVVRAIVQIAKELGGRVIAECVETGAHARAAANLGVEWGQGWHFAKPAPPALRATATA